MSAQIIDGKQIAENIQAKIALTVKERLKKNLPIPGIATILIGDNPASHIYVKHKESACEKVGIYFEKIEHPAHISQKKLLTIIDDLNSNPKIHGILVQLPLPKHLDSEKTIERIFPEKDVDGLHPYNAGKLAQKDPIIHPCAPLGCIKLLKSTGIDLTGKHAVVVGASNLIGRPMALELLLEDCTVTICHPKTKKLAEHVKQGDIVVVAVGKPRFVKGDWIKDGAIVIDVGINRDEDNKLCGDVDFEAAKKHASWITPVPGGVGPMTVAMLLQNTLNAAIAADK